MKNCRSFIFYDNKLSNCSLSLVAASHKLQIHASVRLLTMKMSARECYRKIFSCLAMVSSFSALGTRFKISRDYHIQGKITEITRLLIKRA